MGRSVLLVEGSDDRDFFDTYCKLLDLSNIEVFPPKALNTATRNGWSNLVTNLPLLLNQIKAGDVDKAGIILDADYPPDNSGGFLKRYQFITEKLAAFGYVMPVQLNLNKGEVFSHGDGLPSFGLWIMPDHKSDGMLENFVEGMVSDATQFSLLNHAEQSINNLPNTLFNITLHKTKAKVFTWRAWQKRPGISLGKALQDGILDRTKSVNFEGWIKMVFQ